MIRARLAERGAVRSVDLAAEMNVSLVTVRRDLLELRDLGEVELAHGGATVAGGRVPPPDRRDRTGVRVEAKRSIARAASAFVSPGDVVYLDSGTTCAAMVSSLAEIVGITVVTNDLATAIDLVEAAPGMSVVIAAGRVDGATLSAVGELFPPVLQNFVFDAVFLSASAWNVGTGATTGALSYAAVKRSVLARAKRKYLLVDSSKFGAVEAHVVARLSDLDAVVTDDALAADVVSDAGSAGVALVLGESGSVS
ncbi:DeoR/GlpR family DNA-binding transcription regulator [Rathayibacter sp. ZW T2_19]|uniref:Lactose phosphotransferase system repressor n=1 Tax=Rathayibacter rubneri TaxID=2950106 RepID=A0A9X2DZJ7_9MICO|nr:DeoR/GlpR family DNA-binding transcription regulator [Rathayibacter rubneri]MCM6761659.1 DeoR/GlpR family DNA-binding transcription regulator [Rathayibacter rubneri]